VWELIGQLLGDLVGRRACVIGAGDAYAAFALAGAGAAVTAVDISQGQLDVAAARAEVLGLPLKLVRADAADLHEVASDQFDVVVSTNGFFVWIADLARVFAEIHRILRRDGSYVFYDVHPFQRPVKAIDDDIAIDKPYWATGPHVDGDTFEYHWTISDVLNALIGAGLAVAAVRETPPRGARYWIDGHYEPDETDVSATGGGPLAALPAWLAVATTRL
jgi:SAM-dependent methyltransferase